MGMDMATSLCPQCSYWLRTTHTLSKLNSASLLHVYLGQLETSDGPETDYLIIAFTGVDV